MPRVRAKLTVGGILRDVFADFGIKTRTNPIFTQWTVHEYGISKRRIDTLEAFISCFADGSYHLELEDVFAKAPKYKQFHIKSMDIEATLKDAKWVDIRTYTEEEEVPSEKLANPMNLQDRIDNIRAIVYKVLTFMLLIWQAIKAAKSLFSS